MDRYTELQLERLGEIAEETEDENLSRAVSIAHRAIASAKRGERNQIALVVIASVVAGTLLAWGSLQTAGERGRFFHSHNGWVRVGEFLGSDVIAAVGFAIIVAVIAEGWFTLRGEN